MKKLVNYKVTGEEWNKAKDRAFAKISKKLPESIWTTFDISIFRL